jgi:hypothetical protein
VCIAIPKQVTMTSTPKPRARMGKRRRRRLSAGWEANLAAIHAQAETAIVQAIEGAESAGGFISTKAERRALRRCCSSRWAKDVAASDGSIPYPPPASSGRNAMALCHGAACEAARFVPKAYLRGGVICEDCAAARNAPREAEGHRASSSSPSALAMQSLKHQHGRLEESVLPSEDEKRMKAEADLVANVLAENPNADIELIDKILSENPLWRKSTLRMDFSQNSPRIP